MIDRRPAPPKQTRSLVPSHRGGGQYSLNHSPPKQDEMEHTYLESGWCTCGHHRDDGRNERDKITPPTRTEIRTILGPTYEPKDNR